ncbi:MAG: DUF5082 domain-containing protein [Lachnospiraceae bacterium]|nr:DUF5082 domain-containing protein [Lachnospiraceae bacterium]
MAKIANSKSKGTAKGTENDVQNIQRNLNSTKTAISTVQNAVGIMQTESDALQALKQRLIRLKDEIEEQHYKMNARQTAIVCWRGIRREKYQSQEEGISLKYRNVLDEISRRLEEVDREISRKEAVLYEKRGYIGQLQMKLQDQQAMLKKLCGW